jgi:uncharacterized protein YbjT (DUF2867 family)
VRPAGWRVALRELLASGHGVRAIARASAQLAANARRGVDAAHGGRRDPASIAAPDHRVDFFRLKHATGEYPRNSTMSGTMLRPAAFMASWAAMLGDEIHKKGKATTFGSGTNPVNFVSVADVACNVPAALLEPRLRNQQRIVGGPQNLSLRDVAAAFAGAPGQRAAKARLPTTAMGALAAVSGWRNATLRRQVLARSMVDRIDQWIDMMSTAHRFGYSMTALEEALGRDSVAAADATTVG